MDLDVVRKDAPAAATIERIHGILDHLGFPRNRARLQRWAAAEACHSCHLRFTNYPLIYANGKGVTPDLAYASALAEFMERLQCRADPIFTRAGNIHRLPPLSPRCNRTLDEVGSAAPRLLSIDLRELTADMPGALPCLPFVDVFAGRVVELPFDVFTMMTGTSGMSAGNTVEESLAHGVCEVFERHVIHALESGRVPGLPSVPTDALPVESPVVRRQLDALASSGIGVLVKDATLGGVVPVLALVLTDRAAGTCSVAFGSDPVFDVALSRCITEAFQGIDRLWRPTPRPAAPPTLLDLYNNLEVLFERLVPDVGTPCLDGAFAAVSTNAEALRFAVDCVRRLGRGLFVRDFSLLGFPTHYVYAEGLSALKELRRSDFSHLYGRLDEVRTTLFGLPYASTEEIRRCSNALFFELTTCSPTLERQFVTGVLQAPVASCMGLRPLLVLMLLEAGDPDKARAVLDLPPLSIPDAAQPAFPDTVQGWLTAYANTRGRAVSAAEMRAKFATAMRRTELEAKPEGSEPRGPLPVPRCESVYACPSCPCHPCCRLDEWFRLASSLRARAVAIRQEDLLDRLRA